MLFFSCVAQPKTAKPQYHHPGLLPGQPPMVTDDVDGPGGLLATGLDADQLPPSFRTSGMVLKKNISSIHHHQLERKLDYLSEGLNSKAVAVITRVRDKLTGRDFDTQTKPLGVLPQVDRLIKQATSHENLCQCYIGWCPFW